MNRALVITLLLLLVAGPAAAQKVYKWVDKDGNVHFGDSVPPEYAEQVFGKGQAEGSAPVATSAEVQAELERREASRRQQEADQNLLRTYMTVEEIESVRDRRIEQRQAQDRLTRRYIESLERELAVLEAEAERERAKPGPNGEPGTVSPALDARIADTRGQIELYQRELARSEQEQQGIRDRFAEDISRFRELKGLTPGKDPG